MLCDPQDRLETSNPLFLQRNEWRSGGSSLLHPHPKVRRWVLSPTSQTEKVGMKPLGVMVSGFLVGLPLPALCSWQVPSPLWPQLPHL